MRLNSGSMPKVCERYSKFAANPSIFLAPSRMVIFLVGTPTFRRNWRDDFPSLPYQRIAIFLF